MSDLSETTDPAAQLEAPAWTGVATGAGLALAVVALLSIAGVIAQGFAVEQDTGVFYKMGIAFLRNLDATPVGLMALVALVLVAAPAVASAPATARQNRQAAIAIGVASFVCLVVIFGSVLGVVTRLHFDQGPGQAITTATRRVLATFVLRSMGPALVAFGVAIGLLPVRFPRPVTPTPYAATGEGDAGDETATEPGPGAGAP